LNELTEEEARRRPPIAENASIPVAPELEIIQRPAEGYTAPTLPIRFLSVLVEETQEIREDLISLEQQITAGLASSDIDFEELQRILDKYKSQSDALRAQIKRHPVELQAELREVGATPCTVTSLIIASCSDLRVHKR